MVTTRVILVDATNIYPVAPCVHVWTHVGIKAGFVTLSFHPVSIGTNDWANWFLGITDAAGFFHGEQGRGVACSHPHF